MNKINIEQIVKEKCNDEYFDKYKNYFELLAGNFLFPVTEFTNEVINDTLDFLKRRRDYFILFCSHEDGYEEDFYCVTNFLY